MFEMPNVYEQHWIFKCHMNTYINLYDVDGIILCFNVYTMTNENDDCEWDVICLKFLKKDMKMFR